MTSDLPDSDLPYLLPLSGRLITGRAEFRVLHNPGRSAALGRGPLGHEGRPLGGLVLRRHPLVAEVPRQLAQLAPECLLLAATSRLGGGLPTETLTVRPDAPP